MQLPPRRVLLRAYALSLGITLSAAMIAAAVSQGAPRHVDHHPKRVASAGRTSVSFRGVDPAEIHGARNTVGQAFYYGPLAPGDCLPAVDLTGHEPRFAFHGVGVVLHYGRVAGGEFRVASSEPAAEVQRRPGATHVQACFPGGTDHEQVLWIAPTGAARSRNPFAGGPGVPPPLRRRAAAIAVPLGPLPPGVVSLHGRTIFSSVGVDGSFSIGDERPIVVEFGGFDEHWRFQVRESLSVPAGARQQLQRLPRETLFRVRLPEGATTADFRLAPPSTSG